MILQEALSPFLTHSVHAADEQERQRVNALSLGLDALTFIESFGLRCSLFGSILRPGDFFHHSDIDIACWKEDFSEISKDIQVQIRSHCYHLFTPHFTFDLVPLPTANPQFSSRILNQWGRSSEEVRRALNNEPFEKPLFFGLPDIAFIDQDRLQLALKASQRLLEWSRFSYCPPVEQRSSMVLSCLSSLHSVLKIAEKCAKDILRWYLNAPFQSDYASLKLFPFLIYPPKLGEPGFISETTLMLYYALMDWMEPAWTDEVPSSELASQVQFVSQLLSLFVHHLHHDLYALFDSFAQTPSVFIPHRLNKSDSFF